MSSSSTTTSSSTSSFITALVFNGAVFLIEIALFTFLRPRFNAIYQPRTYVPAQEKRIQPISPSLFAWPVAVWRADYRDIINANGMDAYFFVRFLRVMAIIFLPIWLLSWAVLLPVTSVNSHVAGNSGLDLFVYGNVATDKQPRYAAHLVMVYLFTFWILYNLRKEMFHYIIKRQQHLIEPVHAQSTQAKTLLITGIPAKYLTELELTKLFEHLPGGVNKVWLNRDLKDLPAFYDRRLSASSKLESAETKLLRTATKIRLVADKKGKGASPAAAPDPERDVTLADKLVPRDQRPTHKLGFLGLFGTKVDSIEWTREEIRVCNERLDRGRRIIDRHIKVNMGEQDAESDGSEDVAKASSGDKNAPPTSYPPLSSAFITFNTQIAANLALTSLTHHEPYRMVAKYSEVSPDDVIWSNLAMNPYEAKIRTLISYAITAALIIFWAIPVAFVGIISNVHGLCKTEAWLAWLCKLPAPVVGIISGILPPVLLAVLMMLLPIILRLLVKFEGMPKYTGLELSLMNRYFVFQVVHSFLIVTLSSGIIAALPLIIKNPSSVASLLAAGLPKASTFFLTYILLQGLAGTAGGFLQIVALIVYYVKLVLLGSTPRSIYGIKFGARNVAWGTLFPGITLLVTIALGYMVIAPIVNGLACVMFFMFYMLYKYLFLYQFQQTASMDTGGLFYPKAINHVFVGLYVMEVCLTALFFLAQNANKKPSAVPEGVLMVLLILITIFFHLMLNDSFGPLIQALPLTLAERTDGASASMTRREENVSDRDADEAQVEQKGAQKQTRNETERQVADSQVYANPATYAPQRTVWIPRDVLGLAVEEERACGAAGVAASTRDALMNEKGKVEIDGAPPDEAEKV